MDKKDEDWETNNIAIILLSGIVWATVLMVSSEYSFALLLSTFIGAWMYSDAKGRNFDEKYRAYALGFLLGIIGLIIWFIIRPKKI